MKVICINEIWFSLNAGDPAPKIGDECFVINNLKEYGTYYYELSGFPSDILYRCDHFVELGDETELINQREEECIS